MLVGFEIPRDCFDLSAPFLRFFFERFPASLREGVIRAAAINLGRSPFPLILPARSSRLIVGNNEPAKKN
jgi:hypothetical protein